METVTLLSVQHLPIHVHEVWQAESQTAGSADPYKSRNPGVSNVRAYGLLEKSRTESDATVECVQGSLEN